MTNDEIGDRTPLWFWGMIGNLGLREMTDDIFDESVVDEITERFLTRDYSYNGRGGLFYVSKPRMDMRDVEIWYQMMWYLDEEIKGGENHVQAGR